MKLKVLAAAAALLALAACSSDSENTGANTGAGNNSGVGLGTGANNYAPGSREEFSNSVGDRVFFGYDRYDLAPEARATLERQAGWLKRYSQYRITVEGHADERGTREYNLALGERRAHSVKEYLVALGVPANRVSTVSYGKERPEILGSDESSWAQNRRGVTTLK